jgi:hypothetical protein
MRTLTANRLLIVSITLWPCFLIVETWLLGRQKLGGTFLRAEAPRHGLACPEARASTCEKSTPEPARFE